MYRIILIGAVASLFPYIHILKFNLLRLTLVGFSNMKRISCEVVRSIGLCLLVMLTVLQTCRINVSIQSWKSEATFQETTTEKDTNIELDE